jgi:hypothetical protein
VEEDKSLPRKVAAVDWVPGDWLPGVSLDGYANHLVSIKLDHQGWCHCEEDWDDDDTWAHVSDAFMWRPGMADLDQSEVPW